MAKTRMVVDFLDGTSRQVMLSVGDKVRAGNEGLDSGTEEYTQRALWHAAKRNRLPGTDGPDTAPHIAIDEAIELLDTVAQQVAGEAPTAEIVETLKSRIESLKEASAIPSKGQLAFYDTVLDYDMLITQKMVDDVAATDPEKAKGMQQWVREDVTPGEATPTPAS